MPKIKFKVTDFDETHTAMNIIIKDSDRNIDRNKWPCKGCLNLDNKKKCFKYLYPLSELKNNFCSCREGQVNCNEYNTVVFDEIHRDHKESAWEMYNRLSNKLIKKYSLVNYEKYLNFLVKLPTTKHKELEAIKMMQEVEKELEG